VRDHPPFFTSLENTTGISQEFFYFLFQTQKTYSENCFEKPSLLPSKYGLSSFDTDGLSKEVYST
jgi:hypothetical protein